MVPAADVGKGRLDADVGFDQARDLLQAAAEFADMLRAVGGRVRAPADGLDHLDRLERSLPEAPSACASAVVAYMLSRMLGACCRDLRIWNCCEVVDGDWPRRLPRSVRGSCAPMAIARSGDGSPRSRWQRAIQPAISLVLRRAFPIP